VGHGNENLKPTCWNLVIGKEVLFLYHNKSVQAQDDFDSKITGV
jgi:hypothetical protein